MTLRRTIRRGALRALIAGTAVLTMLFAGAFTAVAADAAATATITGHVTREDDGAPVAGAAVYVSTTTGGFSFNATTDANGDYTVAGLAPGEYTVRFEAIGTGLVSEYWNGANGWFSAQRIVITGDETVAGIDASLQVGGSISGTVTRESDGSPVSSVIVRLSDGSSGLPRSAWTAADGSYSIRDLPAGNYTVQFAPMASSGLASEYWDGANVVSEATVVSVVPGESTRGIDASLAVLPVPATISGRVTNEADGEGASGYVTLSTADGMTAGSGAIGSDGSYSVSVAPGTYILHFAGEGRVHSEFWDDARTKEEAAPLTVEPGQSLDGIDAQLASATVISGVVRADGAPIGEAMIEVMADGLFVGMTLTRPDGAYEIVLPAGTYTVRARVSANGHEYATQYFQAAPTLSQAKLIALGSDGDQTGVDFDLARGGDITGIVSASIGELPGTGAEVVPYLWSDGEWREVAAMWTTDKYAFGLSQWGVGVTGGPLPAGTYTLGVEAEGFCPQYYGGAATIDDAETFDLGEGETFAAADVVLTVDCPAPKPTLALSATSVKAGGDVTVTGENFAPGETVTFELHSDPISLGELVAAEDGTLSGTLSIPSTVPVGAHHIFALGEKSAIEVSVALEVTAAAGGGTGGSGTGSTGGGSGLASTGATIPVTAVLTGLFLAVFGTLLVRRRRSAI